MRLLGLVVGLIHMFSVLNGFSAVRYVNQTNPSPMLPYTDWATAATNIQDAIDAANVGDEILVTNGVYKFGGRVTTSVTTTNRIALSQAVLLRSVNGPVVTSIEGAPDPSGGIGNSAIRCAYVGTNAIISGFTLTNGYTPYGDNGGGVWGESSAVVSNCVLVGNGSGFSGGGGHGGKYYNCTFRKNTAIWGGGTWNAFLYNCILTGNRAGEVGGGAGQCTIYNCTLTGNWSGDYGGGVWSCPVYNSIVYYNDDPGNYYPYSYGSFDYCCTFPLPSRGTGNIDTAPLFIDLPGGNLRLQSNSPCINRGDNSFITANTDLDGRTRIIEGSVDMGAYEYKPGVNGHFLQWMQLYGLPTDGTADNADPDGDTLTNWQEWRAGTGPTDQLSCLRLLTPVLSGSNVVLSWESVLGRSYSLECGADLGPPPHLLKLATNLHGQIETTTYTHTNAASAGRLFYRVEVE